MAEIPVLTNKEEYPETQVLKKVLKESFSSYEILVEKLTNEPFRFTYVWKFYKDGNSWLCRFLHQKKTVFWLSVWDGHFKVAFYFSAKTEEGIYNLDISEKVKSDFRQSAYIGKLKPLLFAIEKNIPIENILKVAAYKIKS